MHIDPVHTAALLCDGGQPMTPCPFSPLLVLGVREEGGAGAHALAPHWRLEALCGVTRPRQHHTNLGMHGRSGKRLSAFTPVSIHTCDGLCVSREGASEWREWIE